MIVLLLLVSCALHQVVPTIDTARFTLLAKRLLAMGRSVFLGGPSGCGKTVLMSQIAAMGKGTKSGDSGNRSSKSASPSQQPTERFCSESPPSIPEGSIGCTLEFGDRE